MLPYLSAVSGFLVRHLTKSGGGCKIVDPAAALWMVNLFPSGFGGVLRLWDRADPALPASYFRVSKNDCDTICLLACLTAIGKLFFTTIMMALLC